MPTAETIDPGFSTADADHPSIFYAGGKLTLTFLDWREQPIRVVFRDVTRFEWTDDPDDYFDGEPYDGTCVVRDSRWPPDIADTKCEHYRLNFNDCGGRLDVACESFDMETQP
ncbi:hypothetical protein [Rhodopirellula sp. SWK7]|uniref:hypothetical protein n=1 Tax=Rhodopirellula sp. SWK7 TaxID=595460 RepID=UPI0002BD6A1A|nr:hypothetical protein [Rhodopirellula sp. SWK7]EMI46044.1 hypothetical protein RRSWK_01448 [Rhodopirellula sp. SWK7]